ncbi:MAG TPA: DUF3047 domain-containing protein [Gemmatimonadales bacterium]|jgi:hypothetical protein|nr:DUF3047 domain-containing protein [Gemmatimonadales bacterium]
MNDPAWPHWSPRVTIGFHAVFATGAYDIVNERSETTIVAACIIALILGDASSASDVGRFSTGTAGRLPIGWHMQTFRHRTPTRYCLVQDGGRVVLAATSHDSASALIADVDADYTRTPWIEWSWKIDHVIATARWGRKSTDDFPARVFVIFADVRRQSLFESLSTAGQARALNYVWANDAVADPMAVSPYSGDVVMIAAEQGPSKAGTWITERRNIVDDFRRAFRRMPPPVRAVAVMTDTDNSHTSERTLYGDIRFAADRDIRQ